METIGLIYEITGNPYFGINENEDFNNNKPFSISLRLKIGKCLTKIGKYLIDSTFLSAVLCCINE